MKLVILTGNSLRHRNFARTLCQRFRIEHVVFEEKLTSPKLAAKEHIHCMADSWTPAISTQCHSGMINSEPVEKILKSIEPDYLIVFGASLLKSNIINIPTKGCLNLHTGLTQYYRGVDSHIWAVMDERLDRIGSTIHFIDESIDAGDIIDQAVLGGIEFMDDLDDVFLRNCILGTELMAHVVGNLPNITTFKRERGKLYQHKDLNPQIKKEAERKLFKMLMEQK